MQRTIDEALSFIEENDIKFIRLAFCDILGRHKNIAIMPQELASAFDSGIAIDYEKLARTGSGVTEQKTYGTLYLRPDPSTLMILPWRPQTGRVARFYCNIFESDGTPFIYDTRAALKQMLLRCKKAGFACRIGLRSEFYIFKTDENEQPTDIPWDDGGYLDVAPLDKGENIRREICLSLEEMGIMPESSHHEAGPGQNEIDFFAADALRSADNFMTYRNVVSAIAAKNGGFASFDPYPVAGKSGNGLHLKLTLHRGGEDICAEEPKLLTGFIGGVYDRISDITVFLNPLESSYARLGRQEAPKEISWSKNNASRLLRLSKNKDGLVSGFVLRSPDPSVNPYLAFAMILEAGLYGIEHSLTLPESEEKTNGHTLSAGARTLPQSLSQAASAASESPFISGGPLSDIAECFLRAVKMGQ